MAYLRECFSVLSTSKVTNSFLSSSHVPSGKTSVDLVLAESDRFFAGTVARSTRACLYGSVKIAMKDNRDFDIPRAEYPLQPVLNTNFDSIHKLPIFWGPKQLTVNYPEYNGPDPEAWKLNDPLQIPKVVRFIYATKSEYNPDDYKDDGGDPDETLTYFVVGVVPGKGFAASFSTNTPFFDSSRNEWFAYVRKYEIQDQFGGLEVIYTAISFYNIGDFVTNIDPEPSPQLDDLFPFNWDYWEEVP